ncbi:MAG TPA: tetratricopeptide repeat protein [Nitrospira sp.]|nr:tetratricopeptide repeat protein [Nitrospira sp.]
MKRAMLRLLASLCLFLQVILAFGSLWVAFVCLSGEVPVVGWLQYPLAFVAIAGAQTILFPELRAVASLMLVPTWSIIWVGKSVAGANTVLEISMASLGFIIAAVDRRQIQQLIRTRRMHPSPEFNKPWWRLGLRYGIPGTAMLLMVGVLFYFFQKAEVGSHEINAEAAIDQGRYAEAVSEFKEALRLAQTFPSSNWRAIKNLNSLGRAYLHSHELPLAEQAYREAVRMCQTTLDPSDEYYFLYYRSIHGLAATFEKQRHLEEAEALYLQAVASYSSWSQPSMPVGFVLLTNSVKFVARLLNDQVSVTEADRQMKLAKDDELGKQLYGLPSVLDGLASLYFDQRQFPKAEKYLKRSLLYKTQLLASDTPDLGKQILEAQIIPDDSQHSLFVGAALYDRFRPVFDDMGPQNRESIGTSLNQIGLTYWEQGRNKEAEPLYLLSLAIRRTTAGENSPEYARTLTNLGLLYNTDGRYDEAEPHLLAALKIREGILDPNHPDLAHSFNNLALLYDNLDQPVKAAPLYEKALAIRQKSLGSSHPKSILTLELLANLYLREANYTNADPLFAQLLEVRKQELGSGHPNVLQLMGTVAGIYTEERKLPEALSLYKRMITLMEGQFDPAVVRQVLMSYAHALKLAGNLKELDEVNKRIKDTTPGPIPPPLH